MAIIGWKPIYETGIVSLDNEHRALIAEINRLYEAIRDQRGDEVLGDILKMLEHYTQTHFQHEEKLMSQYGFPGLAEHRAKHRELERAVQDIKAQADLGKHALAQELLKFLRGWVLQHVVEVDKQYGAYLESRAGRFIE